uniref:C2H2-type domain-containing protein n=1 Tax=Podarcis muralis TaxID=64176 RepID=A0A670HPI0_PODMU
QNVARVTLPDPTLGSMKESTQKRSLKNAQNVVIDFTSPFDLTIHNRMHIEEGPYKCGESFRCSTSLMAHQRIHRGEEPDFGLSHASEPSLVEHNVTRPEKKCFVCSICSRTFGCSGSLGLHQLKHK